MRRQLAHGLGLAVSPWATLIRQGSEQEAANDSRQIKTMTLYYEVGNIVTSVSQIDASDNTDV
jgi:hypothetical protein